MPRGCGSEVDMNKVQTALTCAVGCGLFAVAACTGDDITLGPDAAPPKSDATIDQSNNTGDAGVDGTVGARVLMAYTDPNFTTGELVAYGTSPAQVDGRYAPPAFPYLSQTGSDRFLIEDDQDLVFLLEPNSPWTPTSSWSLTLSDGPDGGTEPADPVQVVESAPNHAYVLRYNRNAIAVIDPTQAADAGTAIKTIDLSALLQSGDPDTVEATGAVFDASRNRLYVALGNIDLSLVSPDGLNLGCANTVSTLIAIDTTMDTLVNLGGTGPGGGVALNGYSPQFGFLGGVVLDPVGDRVLLLSGGCEPTESDGGAGPLQGRLIEAVDLKTNTTMTLLTANDQAYPGNFLYIDGAHALVQFGSAPYATTYTWIPTQTTLGPPLAVTPDVFAYDNVGQRILGPQSTVTSDGGTGPTNVIAVPIDSIDGGGVQVFGQNPFLSPGGSTQAVLYVP